MALWLLFISRSSFAILSSLTLEKYLNRFSQSAAFGSTLTCQVLRGLVIGPVGIFTDVSAKGFTFLLSGSHKQHLEARNAVELWLNI